MKRMARLARPLIGICTLLGILVIGPASASADPPGLPVFDGLMTFGAIQGPSDPEEYSWEVILGEGQALELVDEQHAEVYYTEDHHSAYEITAESAHDADGSSVPTSLLASGEDILTLVVHHRAGNPAAGGAPFVYPVVAGSGWEGGFEPVVIVGPLDEQELREERERIAREKQEVLEREWAQERVSSGCLVPRLKGKSLKASKKLLRDGECLIGAVRKQKGATSKAGKVVKQSPKPGALLAPWTTVKVTLGMP